MNIAEFPVELMKEIKHYPVMYREVLEFLDIRNKRLVVDCTAGTGSHSQEFLKIMGHNARLIAIDRDQESLEICSKRLDVSDKRAVFIRDNFANIDKILKDVNAKGADAFFFDLGISSYQINSPERGFSFLKDGPLDMRMNRGAFLSAYDLINNLSEAELTTIFRKFGEERYAKKIARFIIEERRQEPIATTVQLAQIVVRATPVKYRKYKIHPATRIFQALRIAVNRELESLQLGLEHAISLLNRGGRIAVISFHSLEDRIVKRTLREASLRGSLKVITKKPIYPTQQEKQENPPSRSAKLRVAEKIS